ncbi:uncharacterized protein LOC117647210 [Thrips palmi]|uniref:Uncharacterized protein LOC117647210 n=1 Tax=Thrips palmi TaxID=161013 RepID=A0A6P8ZPV0_THRPL|nr:uncharacterized protein LOC117647210 [Thrips palmi]
MAFSGNQLDAFKQDVYRRIQIAAAVHLIKTTPKGKTHEAHALDIQQKLKLRWLNSTLFQSDHSSNICINQHILRQQQEALKLRLTAVEPQSNQHIFEDNSSHLQKDALTQIKHVSNEALLYWSDLNTHRYEIQANANFIQGVVHLKALAETQSTVPIQQYISSVSKMVTNNRNKVIPSGSVECNTATELPSSDDSGFYNVKEYQSSSVTPQGENSSSVASSMLLYIISSCNADQLLEKSIQAILNQMRNLASGNEIEWPASKLHEVMDQWTGSIHQQAMEVLHAIMGEQTVLSDILASSKDVCFTSIREIIDDIFKNISHNISFQTKENQMMMILQLSEAANLWYPTLELVFSNLAGLTSKIKKGQECSDETVMTSSRTRSLAHQRHKDTQLIHQSFSLFRLLKVLITNRHIKHKEDQSAAVESKSTSTQAAHKSVAGLWRKHYESHNDSKVPMSSATHRLGPTRSTLRHWRNILEDLFQEILYKHPLVAVIIYDCVQMLYLLQ